MASIAGCETQDRLCRLASTECARIGITALASLMVTGPKATGGAPFHFTTWSTPWAGLYGEMRWIAHDPALRYAVASGLPTTWTALRQALPPDDPGHVIYDAARQHGMHEGYVTPVRTTDGDIGLVSAATDSPTIQPAHCHFLQAICTATLHRAEAIRTGAAYPDHAPDFSARELQCLSLLIQGYTDREIASALGISVSTARFHVDNARIKAGARSRVHLAGTAAQWLAVRPPTRRPNSGPPSDPDPAL